jgi:hypothetical protein
MCKYGNDANLRLAIMCWIDELCAAAVQAADLSFIAVPRTVPWQKIPAYAGTSRDICGAQDTDKRNAM